jgi:hypothetical protein
MSLYEEYANEASFRDGFVRPLLNKMGFFLVTELHGSREFGMDFVFSELHRFGGMRYYAAQVKHEQAIRQGVKLEELYTQIMQAFAHSFTLTDSPGEKHVSAVYVFNSGEITVNAKDDIIARMRKQNYGENVYFLDGKRLSDLNRWSSYSLDRYVRNRLLGLKNQLTLNQIIWESVRRYALQQDDAEVRGSLLHGIEQFLSEPSMTDFISMNEMTILWQEARIIDSISSTSRMAVAVEWRNKHHPLLSDVCTLAIERAARLIVYIDIALENLKPL